MTGERITETLEQYAANGMRGAFVHPRPGLKTMYLSDEWFDLWRFAASEADRLGLELHVYDRSIVYSYAVSVREAERAPDAVRVRAPRFHGALLVVAWDGPSGPVSLDERLIVPFGVLGDPEIETVHG